MTLKHHIEQEIKLTALDQDALNALLNSELVQQHSHHSCEQGEVQRFAATYYDTRQWALRDLRWSLRTRYEGSRHVSTLKRNSSIEQGFSSCEEIEQAIDKAFTHTSCVPPGKIADALNGALPSATPLLARVEVTMQRHKRILEIGDTLLELVTDAGYIAGNGKRVALFEVELERLQGDLQSKEMLAFVKTLTETFSLQTSRRSKHQIGLSFYTGSTP